MKLPYRPPLAWEAMLAFLAARAIPGVESVEEGAWRRTVFVDGVAGVVEVTRERDDERPHHAPWLAMRVTLPSARSLVGLVEKARRVFDLGADSARIDEHLRDSPTLAPLVDALPGLRVPGAWDGFELAVRAVLGQQVTVQGATTLAGRLVRAFGTPLPGAHGTLTHLFPRAETLAEADLDGIGLTRARAATLRNLAAAVASGSIPLDASLSLDDAVARLQAVDGVGPWTAQYIAMRALGEPDAFPHSDLGLRHALGRDGRPATAAEVLAAAETWRPWRSYAALRLWNSLGPVQPPKETKE